jgi:hypothetical protein
MFCFLDNLYPEYIISTTMRASMPNNDTYSLQSNETVCAHSESKVAPVVIHKKAIVACEAVATGVCIGESASYQRLCCKKDVPDYTLVRAIGQKVTDFEFLIKD